MSDKVTAEEVKDLREKTGAGMLEVRAALVEAGGDQDKALEILRKKGQMKAGKKSSRQAREGIVDAYIHGDGRIGILLEVNSETDFVARNKEFKSLVHDLALQIAASSPLYVSREDVPEEIVEKEKEILAAAAAAEGKKGDLVEKVVKGRMEKFYQESCLLEQVFIRNPDITIRELIDEKIATLGENIQVKRFTRYVLGE